MDKSIQITVWLNDTINNQSTIQIMSLPSARAIHSKSSFRYAALWAFRCYP
jgi:hypothetical protein